MTEVRATTGVKSVIYERVVYRANGTVDVLPRIRWHRNPIVRVLWRLEDTVRRIT